MTWLRVAWFRFRLWLLSFREWDEDRCECCLRRDADGAPDAEGVWLCRRCWREEMDLEIAPRLSVVQGGRR
jgi:hypothetical protein